MSEGADSEYVHIKYIYIYIYVLVQFESMTTYHLMQKQTNKKIPFYLNSTKCRTTFQKTTRLSVTWEVGAYIISFFFSFFFFVESDPRGEIKWVGPTGKMVFSCIDFFSLYIQLCLLLAFTLSTEMGIYKGSCKYCTWKYQYYFNKLGMLLHTLY